MKLSYGELLLFFAYVVKEATARQAGHLSDILEKLNVSSNRKPLIVVVNTKNVPEDEDSSDFNDLYVPDNVDESVDAYQDAAKEKAKYLLYTYLLRNGDPQNTKEEIEDSKRAVLREALRARCQAKVECEEKCEKKKKRKGYCPVNCKAVFDKLNLCEPPKKEKKICKEEDTCGKRGKTMPPKWL